MANVVWNMRLLLCGYNWIKLATLFDRSLTTGSICPYTVVQWHHHHQTYTFT